VKWFAGYMESAFMGLCTVGTIVGTSQQLIFEITSNFNKIYGKLKEIGRRLRILGRKRENVPK
jgi:hypothetical protein